MYGGIQESTDYPGMPPMALRQMDFQQRTPVTVLLRRLSGSSVPVSGVL
ncbi:MAG: hypothetical protein IJI14_16325 [Anaerolineaceae bacterium]|nr:hypothetical protein [Anaerolineaceae bacterium]